MEYLAAIAAFFIFFLFMAIGLILKGQPLKGSCGGVATLMGNDDCEWCGGDPNKCDDYNEEQKKLTTAKSEANDLAYDATKKQR